jgi:hypothetical protein
MAGSFDIFRKYQRSLLVAVAILAMLAFFVLPPFLDMGPDPGAGDPLVATWRGGGIREGELQRDVAMRMVLNQFLRDAMAASGRDPGDAAVLGEGEADVVRTALLAREADANGIVIGNKAVNLFLEQWTNNMVRPEQFEALLTGRRLGQMPVSAAELFAALRKVLAADRMRQLSFAGFVGEPPGARWDIFRRLEQEATIEVVPVLVESLSGEVAAPQDGQLREFFDRYKDALPVDRSPDPGFKEPHRISYDWLAANLEELEAAAAKDVTDAEIETFYEENKVRLYRAKAAADTPAAEAAKPDAEAGTPPAGAGEPGGDEPAADPKAARPSRGAFVPVKFRRAADPQADAAGARADAETADKPAAATRGPEKAGDDAAAADGVEPLEKVRDDVRERLAADAVRRRLDGLFQAVTTDVAGFSRDLSRWQAEGGRESDKPVPPNVDAIAEKQGLKSGHAQRQAFGEALRAGGIGTSFQLSLDPQAAMGFRQLPWADLFFAAQRPLWRPVETRDVPGNRYLAWKTGDFPASVPEFTAVRADVERAWRIVEARPLARKLADEIAAGASGDRSLADVVAGRPGAKLEAATVGPFTWLSRGSASFGAPVTLSQPEGLEMPGDDFMRAVFALEPGGTAVAFNEPRTVCYVIRLVSFSPPDEELRQKFLDPDVDRQRIGAVAERDQARAFEAWLADVEKQAGLEWKRPPQGR